MIDAYAPVIDAWLRAEVLLKGTVIHERLVAEYGFTGNYRRVKMYLQEARPRIAAELGCTPAELARLHRRFEMVPGAQAQVDWGDEGAIVAHAGIPRVYSFHMVLSYSRDPFCCFTTSQDLATFWACHRRAFAHFGGVPGSVGYDRTKTVVRRHVAAQGGPAAPRGGGVRRALRLRHRRPGGQPADREGTGREAGDHRARSRAGGPAVHLAR